MFYNSGASNNIMYRKLAMNNDVQFGNAESLTFSGVGGSENLSTLGTFCISIGLTVYCTALSY